jgi:hypothetical protein
MEVETVMTWRDGAGKQSRERVRRVAEIERAALPGAASLWVSDRATATVRIGGSSTLENVSSSERRRFAAITVNPNDKRRLGAAFMHRSGGSCKGPR